MTTPNIPPPDPPLRAVMFDLDGLMFNTEQLYHEADTQLLARRGKDLPTELLDQMMGAKSTVALQAMIDWHQLDDTIEELAAEVSEFFEAVLPTRVKPMPGLLELLAALESAEIPKAIATSSNRAHVDRLLTHFEMTERFRFVLTGEDIEHGKPAPDVYELSAETHGLVPAEVLVLEDSHLGNRASVAAGTFAVAVPHGESLRHEFPGVRFVANTLADRRIYQALGLADSTRPS